MDFIDQLKPLFDWLHIHPGWAGLATFLISLTESLVVLGLIIPGSVMMTAVGTLAGAGVINPWQTMVWAILGAIAGDSLSYRIGYHFSDNLKQIWPFKQYPQLLSKGEEFFKKHGGKSVFIGRFVGPVRPVVPVIAGMMAMKPLRFLVANVFSAFLWAPFYMFPGMLIGYASLELEPATATRFIVFVVALLIAIGLSAWGFKILLHSIFRWINQKLGALWNYLNQHPTTNPLCNLLVDPRYPQGHSQLNLALIGCICFMAFIGLYLATYVFGCFNTLNIATYQFFLSLNYPIVTKVAILTTTIGGEIVVMAAFLVGSLFLVWKRNFRTALHIFLLTVMLLLFVCALKYFVESPRPGAFGLEDNSFPSGHTSFSVALYGFMAVILSRNAPRWLRIIIYTFVSLLCLLIASTRLYLGAHWLSDVLGGLFLGLSFVIITTLSWRRKEENTLKPLAFFLVIFLSVGLLSSINLYLHFKEYIQHFTPSWPVSYTTQSQWWQNSESSVPMYRTTRTGKPAQLFNLQWADYPSHIQAELSRHGWKPLPKLTLISTINRISSPDNEDHLPFLPRLNSGQKPVLVMVKTDANNKILMIIRLWNSRIVFTDTTLPLLFGSIEYQMPSTQKFWPTHSRKKLSKKLLPATFQLEPALKDYQWHRILYSLDLRIDKITMHNEWQGGVLFIKPKHSHPFGASI